METVYFLYRGGGLETGNMCSYSTSRSYPIRACVCVQRMLTANILGRGMTQLVHPSHILFLRTVGRIKLPISIL